MTNTNRLLVGIIGVLLLLGVSPEWKDNSGSAYSPAGGTAQNTHRASDEECKRLDKIELQLSRIADANEWLTMWETLHWHKEFRPHPTNRQLKK